MKKKILSIYFHFLARCTRGYIKKHKPYIIGINGSVGKTSCRMIVYQTLKKFLPDSINVYTSPKNFNGDLGMSLSIMQIKKWNTSITDFIGTVGKGLYWRFFQKKKYDVIILEYGIDSPNEMDFLMSIARPNIGIMTKLDSVHSLQFGDPQAIAKEEVKMIKGTKDIAYLNSNDNYARQLYGMINMDKFFYRTTEDPFEVDENHIDFSSVEFKKTQNNLLSTKFEALIHGKKIFTETNIVEKHSLGYISMALSVTDVVMFQLTKKSLFKSDLVLKATEKKPLHLDYQLQPGRFTLLKGKNKSILIDSSYNAAPQSVRKATETVYRLKQDLFPEHKIIIIFGEMRELGDFEEKEHRLIAPILSHVSDRLILVGRAVDFTADELGKLGADEDSFSVHRTALQAAEIAERTMKNDPDSKYLILLKGSQNTIFLEETTKQLLDNPNDSKKLCRQSSKWLKKKERFFK